MTYTSTNLQGAKPRIAILLFGLLNTFDLIYGVKDTAPNYYRAMRNARVKCDVFVDTAEIGFLKIPPGTMPDVKVLSGRSILDRVPASASGDRDYLVIEEEACEIRKRVELAFGDDLVSLKIEKGDPSTWSGPRYLQSMIMTFLLRKRRLVEAAIEFGKVNKFEYDAIALVRPDSRIRPRGTQAASDEVLSAFVYSDLFAIVGTQNVGVDFGAFNFRNSSSPEMLLKNDLLVATPPVALEICRMYDELLAVGSYNLGYNSQCFRCSECHSLFSEAAKTCLNCGSQSGQVEVTAWPEYKTGSRILELRYPVRLLGVTGGVVR